MYTDGGEGLMSILHLDINYPPPPKQDLFVPKNLEHTLASCLDLFVVFFILLYIVYLHW